MNPFHGKRGMVIPGDGVVGRWPEGLFVAVGPADLLDRLLVPLAASPDDPLAALMAQATAYDWASEGGGFVGVTVGDGGSVVIDGAGSCDALINARRVPLSDLAGPLTDTVKVIGAVDRRAVAPPGLGSGRSAPGISRALSLTVGLVPGAGLVLVTDEAVSRIEIAERSSRYAEIAERSSRYAEIAERSSSEVEADVGDDVDADLADELVQTMPLPKPEFEIFELDAPPDEAPQPLPVTGPPATPVNGPTPPMPPDVPSSPPLPPPSKALGSPSSTPAAEPAAPAPVQAQAVATVDGLLCANGHFNHPEARTCIMCGVELDHDLGPAAEGARPALGYLVGDDGTSYQLNQNYLVGRRPASEDGYAEIVLDDEGISRTHARITLDGWQVTVSDAGSKNGTGYQPPGSEGWTKVTETPVQLPPGAKLDIGGRRSFTFEPVHDLG